LEKIHFPRDSEVFSNTTFQLFPSGVPDPHRQKRAAKNPIHIVKTIHRLAPDQKTSRNLGNSTRVVREEFAIPGVFEVFSAQLSTFLQRAIHCLLPTASCRCPSWHAKTE
jgi:hypothetical protein